jgi:hypothetical protein
MYAHLIQYHGSDISNAYNTGRKGGELCDYIVCFVNNLNPNGCKGKGKTTWPQYDPKTRIMLEFKALWGMKTTADTFRNEPIRTVTSLMRKFPLYPGPDAA